VRRSLALALAALAAAPATAAAQDGSGGTVYAPTGPLLSTPAFSVTPATIAPGATLTLRYRIAGRSRRARVRIDLLASDGTRAATLKLGARRTGRSLTATWKPKLEPGTYTARLRAFATDRRARASRSQRFEVSAPPVVAAPGVFPVQGQYSFGGEGARYGATRPGHWHQGQDIMAAAGTPVVAPRAGVITWRAYQADGAGHYVVLRTDDGRDLVFMHFQDGSVAVAKNQAVVAGQRLGRVGSTGRSDGPHLHFEIWPDGWYAGNGSTPIDPLADLLAWAAG
jgi:murein DD-endopeptidase MepM/ murein hydrolase activator NlpD